MLEESCCLSFDLLLFEAKFFISSRLFCSCEPRCLRLRIQPPPVLLWNRDGASHPLMSVTPGADYFVGVGQPSLSGCFLFLLVFQDFADPLPQQPR